MLTKLKIVAYAAPPGNKIRSGEEWTELGLLAQSKLSEFVAYFNPESLRIQVGRATKKTGTVNGKDAEENLGTARTTYSFNLVIDGTGVSGPKITSVKAEVDKFFAFSQIGAEKAGVRAVPFLELIWGDFYVQCQLDSVSINYTLFDPQGQPLRATLDCSFSEMDYPKAIEPTTLEAQIGLQVGNSMLAVAAQHENGVARVVAIARKNGSDSIRGARSASTQLF
jgi:Contractile injection system tube protein